ncbi:hypothetical protein [Streptomyces sp. XD-27]|uniref:hypothetical protein n=1 Tax=Streptomyces sp. XD-27 TaxID=3062779 RepID=UPI0026F442ED|nr:hypothetical protein [Streptomyces sp. XD-27]WKX69303.1 hypothetical protein Q3Y56_04625 [Streptomyces sp. XD-27]
MAVAAALTTTACESSEGDGKADGKADGTTSASASASQSTDAPSKPDPDKSGTAAPTKTGGANSGGGNGGSGGSNEKGGRDYADRQTPPGSVCDNDGQGPYGKIESVNMGGESPYPVMGLVLGMYECGDAGPNFVPTSATGAATNVLVDDARLKVVVGGELASKLGTKTPDADKFLDQLALMEDNGELKGPKAPEFYFQSDAANPDAPDGDDTEIIYLHQIIDGD